MKLTYKQILNSRKGMRTLFGCRELPFPTALKVAENSFSLDLALKNFYEKNGQGNTDTLGDEKNAEALLNECTDVPIRTVGISELEKVTFRPCDVTGIAFMLREDE